MTVYVDDVAIPFGRMKMCHMWAGRYVLADGAVHYIDARDELLAMADAIGLRRKWLQQPPKARWVHFDVSMSLKAMAIERGAVLVDRYGAIEHVIRLGGRSTITLEQIIATRAKLGRPQDGRVTA